MSELDGTQANTLKRPVNDDIEAWNEYWESLGQPWRTEPGIEEDRQNYLTKRLKIKYGIAQGVYPFKDIKLCRADIEWLLSTHDNYRGPVDWNDKSQRRRKGLDLRGADLRGAYLQGLPLARMIAGHSFPELMERDEWDEAAITHLEGANLGFAHLEGADLRSAHLELAFLQRAHLEGADLGSVHLERANLRAAHLEEADLFEAHLEEANLIFAHLEGANFRGAFFNGKTKLYHVALNNLKYGTIRLADIHWNDVNVALIDWSAVSILGDEYDAKKNGIYPTALRAYRQLSIVLRNQGLNEESARFVYHAQLLQRKEYKRLHKKWQYLFSLFLDILSGYGYKPLRCFFAYLLVVLTFATAYFIIGHKVGPVLSPLGSFVFSVTSFHGRGFFPGGIALDDPLTVVAALEAFIGLLIEVTFIATLTQRLFGK